MSGLTNYKAAARTLQQSYYIIENDRAEIVKTLPLFVSFSTEDIHTTRKISEEKFVSERQKPSFGYYECLNCNGLLKYWKRRMLTLSESGCGETELFMVRKAIVDALGENSCGIIQDVSIRPNRKKFFIV